MSDVKKLVKKSLSEKQPAGQLKIKPVVVKKTREDFKALEDLVQCGICLEKLADPRMLTCQHTFCLACLKTHFIAKNLVVKPGSKDDVKLSSEISNKISCSLCQNITKLDKGYDSLDSLPKNLYLESLLKLLQNDPSPVSPSPMDYRCVTCHTVSDKQEHVCQHCMQIFCPICWNGHLAELETNLRLLVKQIEESGDRLRHKAENFSSRCDQLKETVKESVEQKIKNLQKMEKRVLIEVDAIKNEGKVRFENINSRIGILKEKAASNLMDGQNGKTKISTYMNLHRETANLFNEIYHYGEARLMFDSDKFRIEQATEGIYNDIEDDTNVLPNVDNPFESPGSMLRHYKSRNFTPKLVWTKCPRPGGVSYPPWDASKIYIAATDSHMILILDRTKFKFAGRITHPDMLCPTAVTFSKTSKEMFVTDKWKHCVHVFSTDGEYLRNGCNAKLKSPTDCAMSSNEDLIVCDSGNNRIVIVDSKNSELLNVIGKGLLSMPSSVATHGNVIVVADTDNNRVKIFDMKGTLLREIGTYGDNRGQFRSAEVVAMDCLGFIFVGDAGNARIQVFQQDGSFVKIFGYKEGFGWISGICITPELDIITTDSKKKNLRIF